MYYRWYWNGMWHEVGGFGTVADLQAFVATFDGGNPPPPYLLVSKETPSPVPPLPDPPRCRFAVGDPVKADGRLGAVKQIIMGVGGFKYIIDFDPGMGVFMDTAVSAVAPCLHNRYSVAERRCPDCGATLDDIRKQAGM